MNDFEHKEKYSYVRTSSTWEDETLLIKVFLKDKPLKKLTA